MDAPELVIGLDLGQGSGAGEAFGCDLTEQYVIENSDATVVFVDTATLLERLYLAWGQLAAVRTVYASTRCAAVGTAEGYFKPSKVAAPTIHRDRHGRPLAAS